MISLQEKLAPYLAGILDAALGAVMDVFGLREKDYFLNVYNPAVRKALSFSNLCSDTVAPVVEYTVKFILTFVEALVYQEQRLSVPQTIKDVLIILNEMN